MMKPGLVFSIWTWVAATVTSLAAFATPETALAQSRYACTELLGGTIPVVEGEEGMFFRLDPDLIINARFPPSIIDRITEVSDALKSRGTQLVVVPVPPKGLVYRDLVGSHAQTFGFDTQVAEVLYEDTLARLTNQGVAVVDALDALHPTDGVPSMFSTDPRVTNEGIKSLADSVTLKLGGAIGVKRFSVSEAGQAEIPSQTHEQIQAKCSLSIPKPMTTTFDTVSLTSSARGDAVVLAGSGLIAGEGLMARALFAAALGHDVRHVVADGSPLDALIAAVSDTNFQQKAPDVLVWTFSVSADLGAYGPRPWREIVGLARRSCRAISSDFVSRDGDTIDVDLSQIASTQDVALLLSLDGKTATEASFDLSNAAGFHHSRLIKRFGLEDGTERFLLPLDLSFEEQISRVSVTVETGLGEVPSLAICGI